MPAGKQIPKEWLVLVDGKDLSNWADVVDTPQTKDEVDVSGFNSNHSREFLQGNEDATISITFIQDYGTNGPHAVLYPLYASGSQFPIRVQPFSSEANGGTSSSGTNPWFGGTSQMFEYNGGAATLNEVQKFTAPFKPAPNSTFAWSTTG